MRSVYRLSQDERVASISYSPLVRISSGAIAGVLMVIWIVGRSLSPLGILIVLAGLAGALFRDRWEARADTGELVWTHGWGPFVKVERFPVSVISGIAVTSDAMADREDRDRPGQRHREEALLVRLNDRERPIVVERSNRRSELLRFGGAISSVIGVPLSDG